MHFHLIGVYQCLIHMVLNVVPCDFYDCCHMSAKYWHSYDINSTMNQDY